MPDELEPQNSSNHLLRKLAVAVRVLGKELRRLKLKQMDLARADLRLGEKAYATGMADGQAELVSKLDRVAQRVTQLRQHKAEAGSCSKLGRGLLRHSSKNVARVCQSPHP
jgi:hypothetical protein